MNSKLKQIKFFSLLAVLPLFLAGCKTGPVDDVFLYREEVRFDISDHLAPGVPITALYAVDEKNYGYASGDKVVWVRNGTERTVTLTSAILDIAWDGARQTLWAGTVASGLACVDEEGVTYYTTKSHGLPRDVIMHVACDNVGRVWFASSAHLLGGLCCLSGSSLHIFTPENSILPDNLIKDIACCGSKTYVATGGYVGQQKVVEIDDTSWNLLPVEGYYLMDMDVSSHGTLYVIDDVGLSSSSYMTNKVYRYRNDSVTSMLPDYHRFEYVPVCVKADLRDYLWVSAYSRDDLHNLMVYDGENWLEPPAGFPALFIRSMAIDRSNGLWLGSTEGIYILRQ